MKAEIIAVGTELLMGHVVNTNAAEIALMLEGIGIGTYYHTVVGDNEKRLSDVFSTAVSRADVIVVSGGLGPTEDDLTRETVSSVLGRTLHRDDDWARHLEELFIRHRWGSSSSAPLPTNNYRQAMVPEGGVLLPNDRGTAPGIWLAHTVHTEETPREILVALVPGPPREMRGLMQSTVVPRLQRIAEERGLTGVLVSKVLRVIGLGESRVAELLSDLLAQQTNPTIAPLAQPGEVSLRITARSASRSTADRLIAETKQQIYEILGAAIYGEDDTSLEKVVGELLLVRGFTLATAESCTGGLLGDRITDIPGSSAYFNGGIVSYSNTAKVALLGVKERDIESHGAVSEAVAQAMAEGVRERLGSDYGIGITGIAGPTGGSEEKPVGLTYIAVAGPGESGVCREYVFPGERTVVKRRAAQTALSLLRAALLDS